MKDSGTGFKFWTGHGGASGGSIAARALGSTSPVNFINSLSCVAFHCQTNSWQCLLQAGRLGGAPPLTVGLMQMWA